MWILWKSISIMVTRQCSQISLPPENPVEQISASCFAMASYPFFITRKPGGKKRQYACQKMLLEAGADPTLTIRGYVPWLRNLRNEDAVRSHFVLIVHAKSVAGVLKATFIHCG